MFLTHPLSAAASAAGSSLPPLEAPLVSWAPPSGAARGFSFNRKPPPPLVVPVVAENGFDELE